MRITLNEQEFAKCVEFAKKCALNQQQIEFGQSDTKPRDTAEISRDNLIGKMAEVAFAKMLHERCDIEIELDFNYYPRGKWDDQDAEINGWRIDVKATRRGGRWMLIEWSKLDFRQKQDKLSHLYVMASVDWDRGHDLPHRDVELVGCASIQKLKPNISSTKILRKGTCIPGTRTPLQADNYGIPFTALENNWDYVIQYILSNDPPDLSLYPNPYTGKPMSTEFHAAYQQKVSEAIPKEDTAIAQIKTWFKKLLNIKD